MLAHAMTDCNLQGTCAQRRNALAREQPTAGVGREREAVLREVPRERNSQAGGLFVGQIADGTDQSHVVAARLVVERARAEGAGTEVAF